MKKVFLLLVAAACVAVSCKNEIKGEVLTPEENKATLDETMTKAVQMLEVDHWQGTADLITASAVALEGIEGTDKSFEDWSQTMESAWNSEKDGIEIYTVDLEKVQGNLYVKDNKLYASEGKGLTITFPLEDGTEVKGTMTVKNSSAKILVDENYSHWDANGNWVDEEYLVGKEYVVVPASIDAAVTAAGKSAATVKLTTDPHFAGEVPTLSDSFSATLAVTADKYSFAVTRAKYSPTEVAVDASIKYDKTTVVAASFEAKGKIGLDEDNDLDPLATTGKVKASFKILDNVELKGDLDYTAYIELSKKDHLDTEAGVKADCEALEKLANLTLYIQKTAQAKLGFEAIEKKPEGGESYWSVTPVIRFEDGSQYMLPEDFFNEQNFPKTVEAVNAALAQMQEFLAGPEPETEPLR